MAGSDSLPMSEQVRESLRAIVAEDPEIWRNPRRLRSLLTDRCPANKREVAALATSAENRIPHEVASSSSAVPWEIAASRLAKRLEDDTAMTGLAARWVVDTWVLALGKLSVVGAGTEAQMRANLQRWESSGEPDRWAIRHAGAWQSSDESDRLLDELRGSSYWPIDPDALFLALEAARERYQARTAGAGVRGRQPMASHPDWEPSPKAERPTWVYWVFGLFLFLWLMIASIPFITWCSSEPESSISSTATAAIITGVLFLLGGSLMMIPIGYTWQLPRVQRSIVIPCLGSATCAALLSAGFSFAFHEFLFGGDEKNRAAEPVAAALVMGILSVWLVWCIVFGFLAKSVERLSLSDRMYKSLLAGSVLELLVAIPMHLAVRRRGYCCAGAGTGFGIGTGIIVMFLALGPAVFLLFFRRYRQVYSPRMR